MTTTYRVLGATITITTTYEIAERFADFAWWAAGATSSLAAIVVGYLLGSM